MTDVHLRLEGELTIYTAQDTRQRLLQALATEPGPDVVRLDLRAVTETDTAGIQLLLAARGHAMARGGELRFAGMAPNVEAAIRLLGLEDTFRDALDDPPPGIADDAMGLHDAGLASTA
ncbi:STAS domain-containing protein [Bordetella genomosp. 11]|uniref:STAS domain-containing protein n=1 Tax=Bordetella genomosp. 11 TaxID=1416808 RepID=A0A261UYM0_9BORD|nr:STAS domain-containing protein [Bordetella genomosp. 11]OZI66984.1 hypothetical protein CAL28_04555 [Bordetella genomosp. 11]